MKSIILIGMPGSGKSTVGRYLATHLNRDFFDSDQVIERTMGKSLQQISDELGIDQFKRIEESVLLTWDIPKRSVIATGGSVIYSKSAVERLRTEGQMVYLRATIDTIRERVDNWQNRGFVAQPGQSLEDVYQERIPLYQAAAHNSIDVDGKSLERVLRDCMALVKDNQLSD